jgi:hypothetical protein
MRSVPTLAFVSLVSTFTACAPQGSSAYVSFNVPLGADCKPDVAATDPLASGQYDVGSPTATTTFCAHSYFMHLQVNSNLKANAQDSTGRAEPNVLQITQADIRLMNNKQETLPFTTKDKAGNTITDATLPNPFRVQTADSLQPSTGGTPSMGIASIEAIPKAYAPKLASYSDSTVLVQVQLFGTTTGDEDIDFRPFLFPISICRGCLTMCTTTGEDRTAVLNPDLCDDDGAQDGRYCIDPGCSMASSM